MATLPITSIREPLADAVRELRATLEPAGATDGATDGAWRWQVRRRLAAVRDALAAEAAAADDDGWLAARSGRSERHRHPLLCRVGDLGARLLEDDGVEALRHDLARLATDLEHHGQRRRDLAYDEVEMELGGSE